MAMALVAVLLPPLLPLLAWPLLPLTGVLLAITRFFAALPMAQWQVGRPLPGLVLLFALALLPWLLPRESLVPGGAPVLWRRLGPRRLGAAGLALVLALHLGALGGDQLLLIHRWSGDLLLARHRGRGALISARADGSSCADARKLAAGMGLSRYDWITLLDPVAPEDPRCWQGQASLLVSSRDGQSSLQPGQRLESPGLTLAPLSGDSQALALGIGRHRWWLLPDPQSLEAWSRDPRRGHPGGGVWLGFRPGRRQQRLIAAAAPERVWLSGSAADLPRGWSSSGPSGSLQGPAG
jgi:competence protein ComEC